MALEFCSIRYREQSTNGYYSQSASKGKNPLIQLIANDEWSNALRKINGKRAKKWSVSPFAWPENTETAPNCPVGDIGCTSTKFNGGQQPHILPIHQACSRPSVQVPFLERLVAAYSGSLRMRDPATMRTPLHLAIISGASEDVVLYLLKKCRSAASFQDYLGRVPLHYACASPDVSAVVIGTLASVAPETLRATDDLEWTPLHMITVYSRSTEAIDLMLGPCPEAILMLTGKGKSVLDLAKFNTSRAKDSIIGYLVDEERKFQESEDYIHVVDAYSREFDERSLEDNDFV